MTARKSKRRRKAAVGFLLLSLSIVLSQVLGCGEPAPVKIGFSGPLTGKYSDLGVQGRNGAQLAIEDINAAGGVAERVLTLVEEDDAEDPVAADAKLLEQGVVAIIGHMTSGASMAALPAAEDAGITLLSPTTSSPKLGGEKDVFFRVMPSSTDWAEATAVYAAENEGVKRAVIIRDSDNEAYSAPFAESFSKEFSARGGEVLEALTYASNELDTWDEILEAVSEHQPDALMLIMSARDAASFMRRLRVQQPEMIVYSSAWAYTKQLVQSGGAAVDGMVFAMSYADDNPSSGFIRFQKRYYDRFGLEPSFAAVFSYEAAMFLGQALRQTKGEAAGLRQALVDIKGFSGVLGEFDLDEFGDVERPCFILTVEDGKLTTLGAVGR